MKKLSAFLIVCLFVVGGIQIVSAQYGQEAAVEQPVTEAVESMDAMVEAVNAEETTNAILNEVSDASETMADEMGDMMMEDAPADAMVAPAQTK